MPLGRAIAHGAIGTVLGAFAGWGAGPAGALAGALLGFGAASVRLGVRARREEARRLPPERPAV